MLELCLNDEQIAELKAEKPAGLLVVADLMGWREADQALASTRAMWQRAELRAAAVYWQMKRDYLQAVHIDGGWPWHESRPGFPHPGEFDGGKQEFDHYCAKCVEVEAAARELCTGMIERLSKGGA